MVLTVSSWFALASSGEIHVAARWASVMSWCEGMTRHLASGEKDTVFLSVGESGDPFDGDWWVESRGNVARRRGAARGKVIWRVWGCSRLTHVEHLGVDRGLTIHSCSVLIPWID